MFHQAECVQRHCIPDAMCCMLLCTELLCSQMHERGLSQCDHNSCTPQHMHFYPGTLSEQAGVFRCVSPLQGLTTGKSSTLIVLRTEGTGVQFLNFFLFFSTMTVSVLGTNLPPTQRLLVTLQRPIRMNGALPPLFVQSCAA